MEQMLCAHVTNTFMFPKGMLAATNEFNQAAVDNIIGLSIDLASLL